MLKYLLAVVIVVAGLTPAVGQHGSFVSVGDGRLQLGGKPYYFVGTNYWYGSLLGLERKDPRRGVERLRAELDFLKKNGVTNLRLMAGAEGSGMINGVMRVGPPLQPRLGNFDAAVLDGLDLVLAEMAKREMKAVIFFSNNWEWSGGFLQYLIWRDLVPTDMLGRRLTWDELRDLGARFYVCFECKEDYLRQVMFVLDRTNTITGQKYTDDPTIMAWEIANEPRPMRPSVNDLYVQILRRTAALIKARDKNHLVAIGHEGRIGTESMEIFEEVHADPNVDYLTIHIWPKNWGWLEEGFASSVAKSESYIAEHLVIAKRLRKPLVIEEFGLPRDPRSDKPFGRGDDVRFESGLSFEPGSPTTLRDRYYRKIFSVIGGPVAGANFWAYGGRVRPANDQIMWKAGDQYTGDPPMEEQGLNSVFDVDRSTWNVVRNGLANSTGGPRRKRRGKIR